MQKGIVLKVAAVGLAVAWSCAAGAAPNRPPGSTEGGKSHSNNPTTARLRGVFLGEEKSTKPDEVVGRLAIRLLGDARSQQVGLDYRFRSGDRFRFEITSNRDGWLYILHRSPGGQPQMLWPRSQGKQETGPSNHVRGQTTYVVPPSPRAFIFDDEVGKESFYVAIEAEPIAPTDAPIAPKQDNDKPSTTTATGTSQPRTNAAAGAPAPTTQIHNFSVRGLEGLVGRGVVFDPGPEDADPHVYFSASGEDDGTIAAVKFQLRHEE